MEKLSKQDMKDASLQNDIDRINRYRSAFLSSTLNASSVSPRSGLFLQEGGRESSIAGCSSNNIDCGLFDCGNDKENSLSFNTTREMGSLSLMGKWMGNNHEETPKGDVGFGNICENIEFRVSPGTNASMRKMEDKLRTLRARDAARRKASTEARRERSSSRQKIDLEATAKKFLSSEHMNNAVSVPSELNVTSTLTSNQGGLEDATYIVVDRNRADERTTLPRKERGVSSPDVSIKRQEMALKAWLNFLVRQRYGSEGLCAIFEKEKSVAENFLRNALRGQISEDTASNDDFSSSEEALNAERMLVREVVSSMKQLRGTSEVLQHMDTLVQKGAFKIRDEVNLFSDVGLQVRLLKLLFSFHLFWLRCGLEAVLNVSFNGPSCTLHQKMIGVIIKHFFKEPSILSNPKCAKGRNRSLITEFGREELARNFQSKFYRLLYLIDCTKCEGRFSAQTPRMFLKQSSFKNIENVIDALQKEILSGAVNASKLLSRIGINAKYNQGFLEEYHYYVKDLFTDLNDGVILCRVIEAVCNLQPNSIGWCLRNPSGDRLRKLGNMRKVLEAARVNGLDLGDVKAEDLVRGKAEEVLETIWRIVGTFVTTAENIYSPNSDSEYNPERWWQAATRIQRAYRRYRKKKLLTLPLKIVEEKGKEFVPLDPSLQEQLCSKVIKMSNETADVFSTTTLVAASTPLPRSDVCEQASVGSVSEDDSKMGTFCISSKCRESEASGSDLLHKGTTSTADLSGNELDSNTVEETEEKKHFEKRSKCDLPDAVHFRNGDISGNHVCVFSDSYISGENCDVITEIGYAVDELNCSDDKPLMRSGCNKVSDALESATNTVKVSDGEEDSQWIFTVEQGNEHQNGLADSSRRTLRRMGLFKLRRAQKDVRLKQKRVIMELKELFRKSKAAVVIQKHWRMYSARRRYRKKLEERRKAALVIQCWWRCVRARKELKRERKRMLRQNEAARYIQRFWRSWRKRKEFERRKQENMAIKHVRGFLVRRKLAKEIAIIRQKMEDFRSKDVASCTERARPALFRVVDALEDLLSDKLEVRDNAAITLGRLTAVSEECGLYVYKQKGLSFLLDALDSSNRGVHERQVVIHLLLCVHNILKVKEVQRDIVSNTLLAEDLVKSCFHYLYAFYNVYLAALTSIKCLMIVGDINPNARKFSGAKYYVNEALKRFKGPDYGGELFAMVCELQKSFLV